MKEATMAIDDHPRRCVLCGIKIFACNWIRTSTRHTPDYAGRGYGTPCPMHDFPLNTLVNANRNVEAAAPKIEPPRCKHGVVEHWHCPQCANEMTKPHGPVSENFMVHHYGPSGYVKPEAVVPDPATQTKTVFCCRHGQFPNPCQICTGYVVNSAVLSDPKPSHQRELPRRCYMDLYSPGELAISKAVDAVEMMGADVRLTEAVVLLSKAKDKVADFVDGVEGEAKPVASPPEK